MPGSLNRLKLWLFQADGDPRRRATRFTKPDLVVHYWDGSAPEGRGIRDISEYGAYIYTPERWYPGTLMRVVFQARRADHGATVSGNKTAGPEATICIAATVLRQDNDGIAIEFVFPTKRERLNFRAFLASIPVPSASAAPAAPKVSQRNGQALIEFALIMPMVLLLAINAVNFGGFIFAWITVAAAARDGAEYMVLSSASPGNPTPATNTQIASLITSDVTSLLNRSSIAVVTCTNSTTSSTGASCSSGTNTSPTDPEAPSYTLATVSVTYTYNPFIPLFSFPALGISATLPSTTIRRKAVMRMLQ